MNLISKIDGALLVSLSGGKQSSSVSSSVGGKGVSATFDGSSVSVITGLQAGSRLFSDSLLRLNRGLAQLNESRSALGELRDLVSELSDLASRATAPELTEGERATLNSEFQERVSSFRKAQRDAVVITGDDESTDFLDVTDIETMLREAGIDPEAATTLAEGFRRLGGADGKIGFEKIVSEDVAVRTASGVEFSQAPSGKSDPLQQDLQTLAGAIRASADLNKFRDKLDEDIKALDSMFDELRGAFDFAYAAVRAISNIASAAVGRSPESVATDLVSEIRRLSRDSAIGAHSSLDTKLAAELLAG